MKPINLNQARKAKARSEKRAEADANAARFGRTKAEKAHIKATKTLEIERLDNHKLDK